MSKYTGKFKLKTIKLLGSYNIFTAILPLFVSVLRAVQMYF